jgi:hypothetical protein
MRHIEPISARRNPLNRRQSLKRRACRRGPAKMRHPDMCPEPVEWVGRHRWRSGEWVKVWSCDEHAGRLIGAKALPGAVGTL